MLFFSGIKLYTPTILLFSKAIPQADAYISSLFARPVSSISLIIKLYLDGENVEIVVMFLETGKWNWKSLMLILLKENLNRIGLQLAKIEIYTVTINKRSNIKIASNWYFRSCSLLNPKNNKDDKNSTKGVVYKLSIEEVVWKNSQNSLENIFDRNLL